MAKAPLHPVADDGVAHCLRHDETGARRRPVHPSGVHDYAATSRTDALTHRVAEVDRGTQPRRGRQHRSRLSRRGGRGPDDDGPKGLRARRGFASADGSHGCGCDAGCSAGKCAWSRKCSQKFVKFESDAPTWTHGCRDSDLPTIRGGHHRGQTDAHLSRRRVDTPCSYDLYSKLFAHPPRPSLVCSTAARGASHLVTRAYSYTSVDNRVEILAGGR